MKKLPVFTVLIGLSLPLLASDFENYKQQMSKGFEAYKKGGEVTGEQKSEERGNSPCDTNTGYGCTKTVRDDQLNDIMNEDDENFSDAPSSQASNESDDDGSRGEECTNFGYGCTPTVRDKQYMEALEGEDGFSSSGSEQDNEQDIADSGSDNSSDEGVSGNRGECTSFGYFCTSTVNDEEKIKSLTYDDGTSGYDGSSESGDGSGEDYEGSYEGEDEGSSGDRSANASLVASNLSTSQGKNYALIIGIDQYEYFKPLKTAVTDAQGVQTVLDQQYGYETELILNKGASRGKILQALNRYRKKLTSEDTFLIYYAGHGLFIDSTDASYWLPYDAMQDDNTNWIESKSITDQLKLISANNILVVADSCYSGTISRAAEGDLSSYDSRAKYLNKMEQRKSRMLISSGANEPVKDGGGGKHSVFAKVFINALKAPAKNAFTASELLTYELLEPVAGQVEQTPEFKVIRNSGHRGGDFVFRKL